MKTPRGAFFIFFLGLSLTIPAIVGAVEARIVSNPFTYNFNSSGTLDEIGSSSNSSSPYFWLNSGGRLVVANGVGKTIQGALNVGDKWQKLYAVSNPLDTAHGLYPQNLFRLLTRSFWNNISQEIKFNITKTNLTDTPNRDGYSGILLMSRYQDGNNLYYAGIRHDGRAIIKKKLNGTYTTLASAKILPGNYDLILSPNLIPQNQWLTLKSEVHDKADGSVEITLYFNGVQVLKAIDNTNPIKGSAYGGVRTDYMDVLFEDYRLTELQAS